MTATAGYGVTVYILSGGVLYSHAEFGGRASFHWDFKCAVSSCIGGGTIFKVGGGADFLKSTMARESQPSRLREAGGCLRGDVPPSEVGAFLKMWAQMNRFGALFFLMLNI